MKKFIKTLVKTGICFTAGYLTYLYLRARDFKSKCNINKNSLDRVAYFKNLNINFQNQKLHDFKLGCFVGTIKANFKNAIFPKTAVDLTIALEQGMITLKVPENVNVIITSNRNQTNIINSHQNNTNNKNLLIINADIKFGFLFIKTI